MRMTSSQWPFRAACAALSAVAVVSMAACERRQPAPPSDGGMTTPTPAPETAPMPPAVVPTPIPAEPPASAASQ